MMTKMVQTQSDTNFHFEKNNVFTFKISNAIGKIKGLLLFTNNSKTT